MSTESAITALTQRFGDMTLDPRPLLTRADGSTAGQMYITVSPDRLLDVMVFLRDNAATRIEQLIDVTCVDYLNFPKPPSRERYGVTYSLLSLSLEHRLRVKCFVS